MRFLLFIPKKMKALVVTGGCEEIDMQVCSDLECGLKKKFFNKNYKQSEYITWQHH